MDRQPVFAILGGGNGGFCAAADLTLRGYEARLFELPDFAETIAPVVAAGGIELRGVAGDGFARPALVSTDIESVLDGADLILVIVPSDGHKTIAQVCAPYLKANQAVILVPGNCGGALEFSNELKDHGCYQEVTIAETTSLMYAVKKEGPHHVWARGLKNYLPLATFPAVHISKILAPLQRAYPAFTPVANVLDTSLNSLNPIVHPAGLLMNMGFVEGRRFDEWYFYKDGYTQGISRLGEQLDEERLSIVRAFGLPEIGVVEALNRYYGVQGLNGRSLHEIFRDSPIHHPARGPKTTRHRMLTEDVPYGLVPYASFARLAGVETPTIEALITIASVVSETDYRQTGRTVEKLGLGGLSPKEIVDYVTVG